MIEQIKNVLLFWCLVGGAFCIASAYQSIEVGLGVGLLLLFNKYA